MRELPPFLACPECNDDRLRPEATVDPRWPATFCRGESLRCEGCGRLFPVVDGVWVLWSDQLAALQCGAPPPEDEGPRVKWANLTIYEQISAAYDEHSDGLVAYHDNLLFLKALAREAQAERGEASERDRVLVDVGCASGTALDLGQQDYRYRVGVDISLQSLRLVADRGHVAVLADSERLPFREGAVDLLTCFAALHHFPAPQEFFRQSHRVLRSGGVLLTGADPSHRALQRSPIAETVWRAREPLYRFFAQRGSGNDYYLHLDKARQRLNEEAECHRSKGGFDPEDLREGLSSAGFDHVRVFHGVDLEGVRRYDLPDWKQALLKILSGQNPLRRENWVSLSSISTKAA